MLPVYAENPREEEEEVEVDTDAATAAGPTDEVVGKDRKELNFEDVDSTFLSLFAVAVNKVEIGALSVRDNASLDAVRAAAILIGRCLASSIGVCKSLNVSNIRFATEAEEYADELVVEDL